MLRNTIRRAMSSTSSSSSTAAGPIENLITKRVREGLNPTKIEVFNDSHKHKHHQAMRGATNTIESHFRMTIVSDAFQGKSQPARHRMVYSLVADEMKRENGIHALQLSTKTPAEFEKFNQQT